MRPLLSELLTALRVYPRETGQAWAFVVRVTAAAMLALWLAYRFDLSSPQWSVLTVFVISAPDKKSGMYSTFTKSLYRILGTLLGSVAAVIFTAWFAQLPLVYLSVMVLWIGICAGLASFFRGQHAYLFQLSSWTATIVGFGAFEQPLHVFDVAQGRVSETLLGILCVTLSALIFFPRFPQSIAG